MVATTRLTMHVVHPERAMKSPSAGSLHWAVFPSQIAHFVPLAVDHVMVSDFGGGEKMSDQDMKSSSTSFGLPSAESYWRSRSLKAFLDPRETGSR